MTNSQKEYIVKKFSEGFKNDFSLLMEIQYDGSVKYHFFQNVRELIFGKNIILEEFREIDELLHYYINLYEVETEKILAEIGLSNADEKTKLSGIKIHYSEYPEQKPKEYAVLENLYESDTLFIAFDEAGNTKCSVNQEKIILSSILKGKENFIASTVDEVFAIVDSCAYVDEYRLVRFTESCDDMQGLEN